jgi:lipid A 3-O-deacylase
MLQGEASMQWTDSKKNKRRRTGGKLPMLLAAAGFLCAIAVFDPARADGDFFRLDEVRIGGSYHSIEGWPNEHGADVTAEALFGREGRVRPSLAEFFLKPRWHIGASLNTAGDTSQIYAGLTWDYYLTDSLFLEGTFGGAVHDGPLDEPHRASYGCRANFRESAGVGLRLSERLRVIAEIDHMSQAQLCAERNSGLTNVGLKLGYSLGGAEPPLK